MSSTLPRLGVALTLPGLIQHHNWIIEEERDLEIQDFCEIDMLQGDWRPRAQEVKRLLRGHRGRLGSHGPFYGLDIASKDPAIRAVVRARMQQGLDQCAVLGATQMVIHSPFTTWDAHHLDAIPGARGRIAERAMDTLAPVVRRAEELGVELAVENIEDRDPLWRVELARAFNSRAVRVSLDTGHANYAHHVTGGPPVDYYVTAAGVDLAHVHLQDTDGYADRHWHPGEGNVPWRAVFAALAASGAAPRLIIEVKDEVGIRSGLDHLLALGIAA